MRAVLRRTTHDNLDVGPTELVHGDIRIDMRDRTVYVRGTQVHLTPIETRLLVLLMRSPGRTYSRDQIIDLVFGYDFDGFDRTVDAHISNLRSKLELDPNRPRYITTVYGVGYRFNNG